MQDFLGQTIVPGAYLAYACRASSSLWVQVGKVLAVREDLGTVRVQAVDGDRPGTLTRLDRAIVLTDAQVRSYLGEEADLG